jgi:ATP-binding cassette subfamily B protein
MQETDFQSRKIKPATWKTILRCVKRHKKAFITVFAGGFFWGLLDLTMSFLTKSAIDDYMTPMTFDGFPLFVVLLVVTQIGLVGITTMLVCRAAGSLEANLASDLRRDAFEKLQTLSFSYYDKSSVGFLLSRLTNDIWNISEMISWVGIDLMWGGCTLIVSIIAMFIMNVKLALITVAAIPVLVLISVVFQKKILKYQRETRRLNSMITSSFNEGIMGARTTKTLVREDMNNGAFTELSGNMRAKAVRSALISAAYMPAANLAVSAAMGFVLWRGGFDALTTLITVGELNFFINIGNMMFQPIRNFAGVFANFQSSQAAAERVADVLTAVSDVSDSGAAAEKYGGVFDPKRENWEEIRGAVEFRDVSFSYKEGEPVLEHFNLKVEPGEKIALVGATGGGKSTIVNLVCRFYEPNEGAVLIDGKDVRDRSQLWLQSSLGYVLQSPHLFSGTIAGNIRYGRPDASADEIRAVAELIGAHDFIEKLSDGYDTEVGEGGDLISAGQKQLISFARAILVDPKIFILDEATSSIDTESEMKIQKASENLLAGRTSFIVAHRLSSVKNADRILVIDDGKIAETGSHKELMAARGRYYELYTRQFRRDMEELSLNTI